MQSLETAYEEGEVTPSLLEMVCTHNRTFKKAKLSQQSSRSLLDNVPTFTDLPTSSAASTAGTYSSITHKPQFCIHTKLLELYFEELEKDPNKLKTGLKRNTHLLEKLVARERLNKIILNLYSGNRGYSISFPTSPQSKDNTAIMRESVEWRYENAALLGYLNREELPAYIADLLEPAHSFLFYSGCVIAQVHDYRQPYPTIKCDIYHVLLKPTQQSVLADVHKIAEDWPADDRAQLESQILLANHPTLCLAKSPSLAPRTAKLHHNRHILNTHRIGRNAKRQSQLTVSRRKKLIQNTYRPGLEIFEHMNRTRAEPRNAALPIHPIPAPSLEPMSIASPTQDVKINKFKPYTLPPTMSNCLRKKNGLPIWVKASQPQLVEEYILETDMHSKEPDKRRVYHMKLSILQQPVSGEYLGELYLDRDHKKGERNGVACRFSLGTWVQANRYTQQFKEIFTEGGRKLVQSQPETAQPNLLSYQTLTGANSVVNGTVNMVPAQQQAASSSVPILQAQLQKQTQDNSVELTYLATELRNSVQQFQTENAKSQQTQKSASSHPAIINLLNRSPASNSNSDASAAVVNAINNTQYIQQPAMKLLGRKFTVPANARVLNAANVISVNNNLQQQQQITLTTVGSTNFLTTLPKQAQQLARPQTTQINMQNSNFAQIQSLGGLLSMQGQSYLLSMPVTTTANSSVTVSQCNNNNSNVASLISVPSVVLAANSTGSNIAQLVTTGVKRAAGTILTPNSLQIVAPIQRPRQQQQPVARFQLQQQAVQRQTPITIKMATAAAGGTQPANVAKQFQQVQLQLTNQQQYQATTPQHLAKMTRRSSQNVADPP